MTGIELVAGAAVGYVVRKLRRVGERADGEVDRVLDAGVDAVHELVSGALGGDPALAALEAQAREGGVTERTVRRVADAVADAAEADPAFRERLEARVTELQRHEDEGRREVTVRQRAKAEGRGRTYQAGRDLTVHEGPAE
jgi:hypothetical protein